MTARGAASWVIRVPSTLVATLFVLAVAAGVTADGAASSARVAIPTTGGFAGDGGPATQALLSFPTAVAAAPDGGVLIADPGNHRVRRVGVDGIITTVAGSGFPGSTGDGGAATLATLDQPTGLAAMPTGFVIADPAADRVRLVGPDGSISTIAGTGRAGFSGDGGPAVAAELDDPRAVAITPGGSVLISDTGNNRIRRIRGDGSIETIAGGGDDATVAAESATQVLLDAPAGVASTADGGVLIADTGHNRVLRLSYGLLTPVAGTGNAGLFGDGSPAVKANLAAPAGLASTPDGGFVVTDVLNQSVRHVSRDGTITAAAGDAEIGLPATSTHARDTSLAFPQGVAALPDGSVLVADTSAHRVLKVNPQGLVSTIAGRGTPRRLRPSGVAHRFHFQIDLPKFRLRRGCRLRAAYRATKDGTVVIAGGGLPRRQQVFNGDRWLQLRMPNRDGTYHLRFKATHASERDADKATVQVLARRCR